MFRISLYKKIPRNSRRILKQSDPITRSTKCEGAIRNEITGILAREDFRYVNRNHLPPNENALGGRCLVAIKQPRTEEEIYKAICIVMGHTDKENTISYIY